MRLRDSLQSETWGILPTLLVGLTFGAATGLLEMTRTAYLWFWSPTTLRTTPHFLWMTPVADLSLFLAAGVGLAALGVVWRRARSRSVVLGIYSGLSALCLLLLVTPVHDLASLVLAAGIGVQVARHSGGRWTGRLLRGGAVAALLLVTAVGALGWWSFSRQSARAHQQLSAAADAGTPEAGAPNVLLIILDTVRASSLGPFGGPEWTSPALERLASRGVFFENAIAPAPWTLPSHASMFTGHHPHELRLGWDPLGPSEPTLAERLTSEGYATAGFVGNLLYASRGSGLDRGFGVYRDYPVDAGQIVLTSSVGRALAFNSGFRQLVHHHELLNRKPAGEVNREFLSWLDSHEERRGDRPWFAFVNYYDAHEPYTPPDSVLDGREWNDYTHRGGLSRGANAWRNKSRMTEREALLHAFAYHQQVRRADEAMGRLVDELERRNLLDSTLVVIASDHGEQLGEHGLFGHNNSLYINTLHVPLLMLWPGRLPGGERVSRAVNLRDLPATILELAAAESRLPGHSLVPTWRAPADSARDAPSSGGSSRVTLSPAVSTLVEGPRAPPYTPISRGPYMQSIVRLPYHYIRNGDGTDAIFDLESDPREVDNLAGTAAGDSALVDLRAELFRIIMGRPAPPDMPIRPFERRRPPPPGQ